MQELVIASNNAGKIREIRSMIDNISLLSLKDIGFSDEIPEPYDTFEQNAHIKAETIHRFSGKSVFADDSGICVPALGGAPGVFSARYAGVGASDEDNLQKLLAETATKDNRSAYYKAVICLIWKGETHYFEGVCHGSLLSEKRGTGGFGYDPIFVPDGYEQTFAELPLDVKNNISHRGKAVRAMVAFLKEQTGR
ncbi:RdgB/HAM1 family non-canonical purine NTP pyrophosphatase [Polluticoccus soli]|uniref:RdgB/HAM1 family non-canonical purine NTP pyrophosphatase n=1 Tax=Polluticoccus soli TaxID=3034150 RepID=UPI0023E09ABB|nr:RdgB/HAM1 family non-canonical purine NTP pyrophosphatase [Flavipsychrobacter sp. JY13-12]